ncbi:MAG: patatin-like phospholipase family protein, partial [Mycobacterium leprae]
AAIARGARTLEPILFVGEAGAGKELAAARVHYNGARHDGPFIVFDLGQWNLTHWQESLRLASHGTLLLKQAHLAPPEAVAAIRSALPAERRPGARAVELPGREPRLLATAPAPDEREPSPLEELFLAAGFAVPIPALRERREDVPALVRHYLKHHGSHAHGVTGEAMRKLQSYPYLAGNVRELERVLQQALVLAGDGPVAPEHLRLGRAERRSCRPLVGLALGGGVVRGMAHIGVLKLLAEAGIQVDMVAGTSSGSLVGALYAGGLDVPALEALVGRTGWFDLATPCWPSGGFLNNQRMRSFLDRQIGPVRFADLRLPFAVVAGDATSGAEVILREGPVADAVRGSTAIPGIFRPVLLDDRYLVDGVVVNNVPASVVRAMGADVVIAVDITQYSFGPGRIRSLPEAMMRAFDIMARQTVEASLEWADIVIRPRVSGMNGFAISLAPEYIARGYAAAREQLGEIRTRLEQARQELNL